MSLSQNQRKLTIEILFGDAADVVFAKNRRVHDSFFPLPLPRQSRGQQNRFHHAGCVCFVFSSDVVRRAMIHRCSDERRTESERYAAEEVMELERDQSLVVVHANDGIVIAARRLMKQAIGGKRSARFNSFSREGSYGRDNRFFLLIAKNSFFPSVRVQRCNRNARPLYSEQLAQPSMRQFDRVANGLDA